MIKKVSFILLLSAVHFGILKAITHLSLSLSAASYTVDGTVSAWTKLMVAISRVLYFPIISLSLYSRQWFPGDLIAIPIAANSLLWGIAIFFIAALVTRIKNREKTKDKNPMETSFHSDTEKDS